MGAARAESGRRGDERRVGALLFGEWRLRERHMGLLCRCVSACVCV